MSIRTEFRLVLCVECRTPEQSPVPELARVTSLAGISQRNAPFSERRSAKYPSGCTRVGSDMAHDEAIGVCGKGGRSIPAGVGQPPLLLEGLTVGGTAA